ncbi:ATP-binding protein [uncultured Sphingomonas sp.]|uniref:ATP-binding protein n=1 Tax=uncultured Sphingomonas sp. TaxID=158754 RepID=UPI00260A8C2E|nr:ATP-binding protein [uncultured Sphingomonas sp.]
MRKTDKNIDLAASTTDAAISPKVPARRAPRTTGRRATVGVKPPLATGMMSPAVTPRSIDTGVDDVEAPDLATIVGNGLAAFKGIILPTAPQQTAVRQMHSLLVMGEQQPVGQMRRAYRYLNHSGSGKSTSANILRINMERRPDFVPDSKPVLHVTLSTTGTPKSLASSILDALGDNYSTRGEAELLLRRVRQGLQDFDVKLLIIDELNHFRHKSMARDAANTIKNILTLGWVPVVLMGTTAAQSLFTDNRELKNRCAPQVVLSAYDVDDRDGDLARWTDFLKRMDMALVNRKILGSISGLADPFLAEDLCRASNGLIGELHNILLAALEETLLAGEPLISMTRIADAVDAWCMADGTIDRNFVREGFSANLAQQRSREGQ